MKIINKIGLTALAAAFCAAPVTAALADPTPPPYYPILQFCNSTGQDNVKIQLWGVEGSTPPALESLSPVITLKKGECRSSDMNTPDPIQIIVNWGVEDLVWLTVQGNAGWIGHVVGTDFDIVTPKFNSIKHIDWNIDNVNAQDPNQSKGHLSTSQSLR